MNNTLIKHHIDIRHEKELVSILNNATVVLLAGLTETRAEPSLRIKQIIAVNIDENRMRAEEKRVTRTLRPSAPFLLLWLEAQW